MISVSVLQARGGGVTRGARNGRRRGEGTKPFHRDPRQAFGAIDLGTNNCRLLIARPKAGGGFHVIEAFSRIVRLGEGLGVSGRLSEAAMSRTLAALAICSRKLRRRGVTQVRAVATEACRRAENCALFVDRVARETGIDLEVISNREEVGLAADGCVPLLDPNMPDALIFDIGGGSTEISWLKVARPALGAGPGPLVQVADWCSFPFGVVSYTERFGCQDVVPETFEAMVSEVASAAASFEDRVGLGELVGRQQVQLLGTSGTVTTLTGVHLKLPRYDRARVDGYHLNLDTMQRISRSIRAMSYDERKDHGCIGPERADLVIAGCAILEGLCRIWPAARLRVADRGLREGILLLLMQQAAARPAPQRRRRRARSLS
jgi:exopolyphosphatase/guanosine-5'-triphosphate,3'-diphosphate pyrophosphatase